MTRIILTAALLIGCYDSYPHVESTLETSDSRLEAPAPDASAPEKQLGSVLCFRVDDEVMAVFPEMESAVVHSVDRVRAGWAVEFRDPLAPEAFDGDSLVPREPGDCDSRIRFGVPRDGDGNRGIGAHNAHSTRGSAAYVGGMSLITIDRKAAESTDIADINMHACLSSDPHRYLLVMILTHEILHLLGVDHNDDPESPMGPKPEGVDSRRCYDPEPTGDDIAAAFVAATPE